MSPNTEPHWRDALNAAGALEGSPTDLPSTEELIALVEKHAPPKPLPQQTSMVERWKEQIGALVERGAKPQAIWSRLRLDDPSFDGSLSAVKRIVKRIKAARGPSVADVVIPVETGVGEVAQVDFGYVGKLYDPDVERPRKADVFLLVLGYSRQPDLPLGDEVELVGADHLGAEHLGRALEVLGELGDRGDVELDGLVGGVVADAQVLDHAFDGAAL